MSRWKGKPAFAAAGLIFWATVVSAVPPSRWKIDNPYQNVDWLSWKPYKASLHIHTMMSDGSFCPAEAIDAYARLGYAVLALADHDTKGPRGDRRHPQREKTTWPWPRFDRDPVRLGMVAIEGNEMSAKHHIGSYFNEFGAAEAPSVEFILGEIYRRNGLAVFFHPGRYNKSPRWYTRWFRQYPHLIGMEVYSDSDSFPQDREKWDEVLAELGPDRVVWGFSNDDMHEAPSLGRNWNVLLLPELSASAVRRCLETGAFFYVYSPEGPLRSPGPPAVFRIRVDETAGLIAIETAEPSFIRWISKGKTLQRGPVFRLDQAPGGCFYVRAELTRPRSRAILGTQPFRFSPTAQP